MNCAGFSAHLHAGAQGVDARVLRDRILVVRRRETPVDRRDHRQVLDAMVAISGFPSGPVLSMITRSSVSITMRSMALEVHHVRVQAHCALDRRLRVELGGEARCP